MSLAHLLRLLFINFQLSNSIYPAPFVTPSVTLHTFPHYQTATMKSILPLSTLLVAAVAQSNSTATKDLTPVRKCIDAGERDSPHSVNSVAGCVGVPHPSVQDMEFVTTCIGSCPMGDGSADAIGNYTLCRSGCINRNIVLSETPLPTGESPFVAFVCASPNSGKGFTSSGKHELQARVPNLKKPNKSSPTPGSTYSQLAILPLATVQVVEVVNPSTILRSASIAHPTTTLIVTGAQVIHEIPSFFGQLPAPVFRSTSRPILPTKRAVPPMTEDDKDEASWTVSMHYVRVELPSTTSESVSIAFPSTTLTGSDAYQLSQIRDEISMYFDYQSDDQGESESVPVRAEKGSPINTATETSATMTERYLNNTEARATTIISTLQDGVRTTYPGMSSLSSHRLYTRNLTEPTGTFQASWKTHGPSVSSLKPCTSDYLFHFIFMHHFTNILHSHQQVQSHRIGSSIILSIRASSISLFQGCGHGEWCSSWRHWGYVRSHAVRGDVVSVE
jgi:hypothetical protein